MKLSLEDVTTKTVLRMSPVIILSVSDQTKNADLKL